MDRTADQVAADNALDEAIRDAALAYGLHESDELITSWVVVGAVQSATDPDDESYLTLHPSGTQPSYIAVGLLRCGEAHLLAPHKDSDE